MCGIFGFVSKNDLKAVPIILDGLKRLEYRGYDSSGIAAVTRRGVFSRKKSGRISELEKVIDLEVESNTAIGHTRWSTHGAPTDKNSHPHFSCDKKIYLVHNGIIENFRELKTRLLKKGHKFTSDTDTEVIAHLVEDFADNGGNSFEESVRLALKSIVGTYAFAVVHADHPGKMVIARNSSPLLVGFSDDAKYVASDASAIMPYTRKVVYLEDGEFAILTPNDFRIATLDRKAVERDHEKIEWSEDQVKKNKFPHFMLKEIYEEPEAVENAIRGRLIIKDGLAKLGGLEAVENDIRKINRLIVTACGTAYYAGLVGEYMIEEHGGIQVETEYASELRYKKNSLDAKTALLAVSQSGETADTLSSLREVKRKGLMTIGVVNMVGSSIARETRAGIYNHAGPEIGVASTKAFVSQVAVMALLTLFLGRQRDLSLGVGRKIAEELNGLPGKMRAVLSQAKEIKKIARKYYKYNDFLYLGRKYNYPVALEGALKLKEVSYIHAEGYGAGEMKHGPLAMIDANFPSIVIVPSDSLYEKVVSNIQEIKARKGPVIAIATQGNKEIAKLADDVIYIPETLEMLTPILSVMPLHLFAYYVGVLRGHDVDKPRNLAKSVTVE
ncbi:MAG: glutamine--fructose-6-phosphate transaminase (isomerizing) [Candidatus Taylorbacteria bacterium]|nr:glutamine--fructose-6-phosphate transaminase (isomerizing) [Candidatus Taylorbacteria bacterium]